MGGKLSVKREQKQKRRNVPNGDKRSYDFLTHVVEGKDNERYENERYVGYEDDRHEDQPSSESEESSIWTTEEEEKCYDPKDSTLTFVDGDDDLDFLCNDYKSLRAKMSCGHAVTPTSLTDWCSHLLDQGDCKFVCGQTDCDVEWPFEEVRKMALLTPEEVEEFEKKLFRNAAKDFLDIKSCPGCNSRVVRTDLNNLSVKCPVCTAERRRRYLFCWQCLKKWKGPRSDCCAHLDCKNPLEILKSCPDITFKDVKEVTGCPSIRACPICGFLVEHNKNFCKTIVCRLCKVKFCFVCLKLTKECKYVYERCSSGVAPRQTSIPVWKRT
ncbi:uncharacterized protein LOC129093189 [Anoplopoma fimbria]|uniref:uncharacterized protein LOC129093189 n=1 Tax=Anoplopoma fimbria TaxID=229290 RepID=UPI0023EAEF76|nr:uncharacterized protein LOC129093189 [Anoplopoma fimbria]